LSFIPEKMANAFFIKRLYNKYGDGKKLQSFLEHQKILTEEYLEKILKPHREIIKIIDNYSPLAKKKGVVMVKSPVINVSRMSKFLLGLIAGEMDKRFWIESNVFHPFKQLNINDVYVSILPTGKILLSDIKPDLQEIHDSLLKVVSEKSSSYYNLVDPYDGLVANLRIKNESRSWKDVKIKVNISGESIEVRGRWRKDVFQINRDELSRYYFRATKTWRKQLQKK